MENLETDVSYILGRYIGVARKIELELDRLTKKETPSAVEEHFESFLEHPAEALRLCQQSILKEQMVLKTVNRMELVEESAEIFKMVNVEVLEHITLNAPNFLHGYHVQLDSYTEAGVG